MSKTKAIAIGVPVLIAVVALVYGVPELMLRGNDAHLTQAEHLRVLTEDRRTVIAALAALGAAGGLIFAYLRHDLDRDSNRTDRYAKAVELIAHENTSVQLGGIYALERIAIDSSRDRAIISELLSAFVRDNAPKPPPDMAMPPNVAAGAALTVLSRRPRGDESYPPADLRSVHTHRATYDLRSANLAGANLRDANFSSIDLTDADLSGANLMDAIIRHAVLDGADFSGARIIGTSVHQIRSARRARFDGALIDGSHLTDSNFKGASFRGATIVDGVFDKSDLDGVDFTEASISEVFTLRRANITPQTKISAEQLSSTTLIPDDQPWSDEETDFFRGSLLSASDVPIGGWSRWLGRSDQAIQAKADELNLTVPGGRPSRQS